MCWNCEVDSSCLKKSQKPAHLGVVVVVEVIRLLWDGRFLVLCQLVLVAGSVSWEAHLFVQHRGWLWPRHAGLLHRAGQLWTVQTSLLLNRWAVAVHGDTAPKIGKRQSASTLQPLQWKICTCIAKNNKNKTKPTCKPCRSQYQSHQCSVISWTWILSLSSLGIGGLSFYSSPQSPCCPHWHLADPFCFALPGCCGMTSCQAKALHLAPAFKQKNKTKGYSGRVIFLWGQKIRWTRLPLDLIVLTGKKSIAIIAY